MLLFCDWDYKGLPKLAQNSENNVHATRLPFPFSARRGKYGPHHSLAEARVL